MAVTEEARAARDAKLDELHERLTGAVETLVSGEDWARALDFAARFRSRSFNNTLLVWVQHEAAFEAGKVPNPVPSYVAGYRQWQQLGRQVQKGQRGLLSATATRPTPEGDTPDGRNPIPATPELATEGGAVSRVEPDPWHLGDQPARPLRALGAVLGDLADLRYDTRWLGLPASAIGAPHPRFRIFILAQHAVPNPARLRLSTRRRNPDAGQGAARHDRAQPSGDRPRLTTQPTDTGDDLRADRGVLRRWGRYAPAIARWERITGRPAPAPAILNEDVGPRPAPAFVEWLMGLPPGWVTDPGLALTHAQQLSVLGNGVVPPQAARAIFALMNRNSAREECR